jgi:hypothetical protein
MRRFAVLCGAALLIGCARGEKQNAGGEAAQPAAIMLADVAGTWNMTSMPESSDSVLVSYTMTATADTTGWTVTFAGRDPIPMRGVMAAGDSIVSDMGPYESMLRPGVMVSVHSVSRLQDGKLVGHFTAHYAGGGADTVLSGRMAGTRPE